MGGNRPRHEAAEGRVIRTAAIATIIIASCMGSIALAQKPVSTPEELTKAMKRVKTAMDAAAKAANTKSFAEVGRQLAVIKGVMNDTRDFWAAHKKDDAVKANRDTVLRIEDTEKLFARTPGPSPDAGIKALKYVEAACRVCHDKYRVRDANNNWILKPGAIDK